MTGPLLGVVADDLTGACDLAGNVAAQGLSTVILVGADTAWPATATADADCVVIALKNRSSPPAQAAGEATDAAERLQALGARLLYQKYCSTFDSTPEGNIGPIGDALAATGTGPTAMTVGTPATPAAGRTQYLGHLFVGERLLSESSMRDHPLTPMRNSDLVALLTHQTPAPVALLPHGTVRRGVDAVAERLSEKATAGVGHVLVDAITQDELDVLATAILRLATQTPTGAGRRIVATGAAGLATAIARAQAIHRTAAPLRLDRRRGRRLIVSGSASEATRAQNASFSGLRVNVDALQLAQDERGELESITARIRAAFASAPDTPVLVSATTSVERMRAVHDAIGVAESAALVERALASVAAGTVAEFDVTHLIVAGGETSGGVISALGVTALRIGEQAAIGVPWTIGDGSTEPLALLLKSGNFGDPSLFDTAWRSAP